MRVLIYDNERVKMLLDTDDLAQIYANVSDGDRLAEVMDNESIFNFEVVNGELIRKE